jgi:hypothetical protein
MPTGALLQQGNDNTAAGAAALLSNTTGGGNTAAGAAALLSNITGGGNTAAGGSALNANTKGGYNTAAGAAALNYNTTGGGNTALGYFAGGNNVTGSNNTFIGSQANANAGHYHNGTAIGNGALLTASNAIVLGNRAITKIYAEVTSLTAISDRQQKKDIAPLGAELGLAFVEKLKPVSYRFKNGDETLRYGFVAQDLEQALPAALHDRVEKAEAEHGLALIERQNDETRTYRVAYGELTAPLVEAIQEQQREIAVLEAENAALHQALAEQAAADKAQNDALRQSLATLARRVDAMTLAQPGSPPALIRVALSNRKRGYGGTTGRKSEDFCGFHHNPWALR